MKNKTRQHSLGFMNRGGKRRGAGRKPKGERAGVPHAKRPALKARFPVSLTMRLRSGLPSLRDRATHEVLKVAFARASAKGLIRVIEYSVQSNHLHMVAESNDRRSLARGMIGLTVLIARGLNKLWRRAGNVFPDRYHSRILTTPREVRNALRYVLQNGRKHSVWRSTPPGRLLLGPFLRRLDPKGRRISPRLPRTRPDLAPLDRLAPPRPPRLQGMSEGLTHLTRPIARPR